MATSFPITHPIVNILLSTIAVVPASYLLAFFVTRTDGPLNLFSNLRQLAGIFIEVSYNEIGDEYEEEKSNGSFWADVLSCHICTTPYATAVVIVLFIISGLLAVNTYLLPLWLTSSGLTVYMFEGHDE